MFFNYVFTNCNEEQIIFHAVETLSVVLTNYAKCKGLTKPEHNKIAKILINEVKSHNDPDFDKDVLEIVKNSLS